MCALTVLVCTHNRVRLLERTLESLNRASRPQHWQVHILVAANACTDGTHAFLERYRQQADARGWLPLEWFIEPIAGKSNALNSAMPRLTGDLVAFVDDDHRVHMNYLVSVCRAAESNPETDFLCGRILPDWDGTEPTWVHDHGPYRIYPLPVPRFDLGDKPLDLGQGTPIPGGGNLAARTTILPKVGNFDPNFGPTGHDLGGAEDLEWLNRALHLGASLRYEPDILQYHYVDGYRLTLGYLMRKAYIRSASSILIHPERVTETPIPPYMLRKTAGYLGQLVLSWKRGRRRFYLVRLAAVLGEIRGHLQAHRELRRRPDAE